MSNIKELREKVGQLAKSMSDIGEQCRADGNRIMNAEERGRFDKAHSDWKEAKEELQRALQLDEVNRSTAELNEQQARATGTSVDQTVEQRKAQEKKVFRMWLEANEGGMTAEERNILLEFKQRAGVAEGRAMSTTGSAGGYTVPQGFLNQLAEALKYFGGVRSVATIMSTESGNSMMYPCVDDTSITGELLAEAAAAATSSSDPTFAQVNLLPVKWSSKVVKISLELLQDSAFNLEAWLAKAFAIRIARIENSYFTTGTGTSQPQGVVTAANGTGVNNAAATAIGYTDCVNLKYGLNKAYRMGASWMFNDQTEKALIALSIGTNYVQPLWTPSIREGAPDLLLGHKYVINNDMADIGASAISMLFGDFSYYVVRDVPNATVMQRFDELYAVNGQKGYLMFTRSDGKLASSGTPIKKLTHAAS